ncbi:MAG: Acetyl-/propionyl-coenzyme A carboxylase alpha chain [Steroidobacteraceae bacterium]|nr:Acetyl-/propionyl-coenzyme A carboxylase alpha chain [Steroidobacteraceae bacterium]
MSRGSTRKLRTLLVANRGEIACRVMRTARRLGMRTVAVYSDADIDALHVRTADAAVRIGPAAARESYLDIEAVIRAARESGADAIHPGYGFLSQNAEFADACAAADIVFVGPSGAAMRAMGRKDEAKALMHAAGVPVVPGWQGEDQSDATLLREAERIGFPLLVKAVAGGGGKGMRVARSSAELPAALPAARGEAMRAFGDGRLLLERFIEAPRHVEVQVIADRHGRCLHLHERDCSLQRRYQKVIEECPAPGLSPALRERLHDAAVRAAQAVHYENAGTVEFIVAGDDGWFLEMNTRLQVEHPVTEAVLGIDLVEWQLRVAAGEPLPAQVAAPRGHAFEARVYAEDPRNGYLPTGGRVEVLRWPERDVRVDAAVEEGDRVVTDYDALLAKVIVHADSRAAALTRLEEALLETRIEGVTTNLAALVALTRDADFRAGRMTTGLIDARGEALLPESSAQRERAAQLAAAALLAPSGAEAADPWAAKDNWRLQGPVDVALRFTPVGGAQVLKVAGTGHSAIAPRPPMTEHPAPGTNASPGVLVLPDEVQVWLDGEFFRLARVARGAPAEVAGGGGDVLAPMPGAVLDVRVKEGEEVTRGQPLVVLEAMKMEHTLRAAGRGRVASVHVRAGTRVREGERLLSIEEASDA